MARPRKIRSSNTDAVRKLTNHSKQLPRLRRIEGQVRGLQRMIQNERVCIDIAHQINATIAALRRVQGDMLDDYLRSCAETTLTNTIPLAERLRLAKEVGALITRIG